MSRKRFVGSDGERETLQPRKLLQSPSSHANSTSDVNPAAREKQENEQSVFIETQLVTSFISSSLTCQVKFVAPCQCHSSPVWSGINVAEETTNKLTKISRTYPSYDMM
jgi:hypothetical protein